MKLFVSLFFIFFLSLSAPAKIIAPEEMEQRLKNAVGMVAVSGFGRNILATGFFISDKWFVTEFLGAEQLSRRINASIAIWIRNRYFTVERAYALSGTRNLAILEIKSSYTGGVLPLAERGAPTDIMYGTGFDINVIQTYGYYVTGEEILRGAKEGRTSRFDSANLLSIIPVKSYRKVSGYQFYQLAEGHLYTPINSLPHYHLTGGHLYTSTNGLPFLNQNGEVIGIKFGNVFDLAYATPVEFLKDAVKGKGKCEELSLQDCLDKSVEDLYEEAQRGDPIAQHAHNSRLYTALDESIVIGNEAIDWLLASAETGNVLSQLQMMMHITSDYECFALPEGQRTGGFSSEVLGLLKAVGRMFTDKEEVMSLTLRWLEEMRQKDFVLSYFLKGLMLLNGHCMEQDIPAAMSSFREASRKGFTPIDYESIQSN